MRTRLQMLIVLGVLASACSTGPGDEPPADAPESAGATSPGAPCAGAPPAPARLTSAHDLLYVSDRGGTFDLWAMRPDGTGSVRLTDDDVVELTPAWSPDGTRIAFACAADERSPTDLYVMDADGSDRTAVTTTSDECEQAPQWTPEGDRLFFASGPCDGQHGIDVVRVDGSERAEVVGVGQWPALSPDGERLLYDVPDPAGSFLETTVWARDVEGGAAAELGPPGVPAAYESAWSPDGERVAFVVPMGDLAADDPAAWNEEVFVMAADGSDARRLTRSPGNDHWPPAWSPDGRELVVTSDGADNEQAVLHRIDLRSGDVTPLTPPRSVALFPDWRW